MQSSFYCVVRISKTRPKPTNKICTCGTSLHGRVGGYLRCVRAACAPCATFAATTNGPVWVYPLLKLPLKESKPIGHKNCINTPPSHKHCTTKQIGHVECLKGATIRLQTETNPSIAVEGSRNAIRSNYGLKYGCLVTPDSQIPAPRAPRQVDPHVPIHRSCHPLFCLQWALFQAVTEKLKMDQEGSPIARKLTVATALQAQSCTILVYEATGPLCCGGMFLVHNT